jgi:hypothetical protein
VVHNVTWRVLAKTLFVWLLPAIAIIGGGLALGWLLTSLR